LPLPSRELEVLDDPQDRAYPSSKPSAPPGRACEIVSLEILTMRLLAVERVERIGDVVDADELVRCHDVKRAQHGPLVVEANLAPVERDDYAGVLDLRPNAALGVVAIAGHRAVELERPLHQPPTSGVPMTNVEFAAAVSRV
jgi:hypothetical protein